MSAPPRQRGREGLDEGNGSRPGASMRETAPSDVHEVLRRHILLDCYPMVFDPVRSHGSYLVDARDGTEYLDFYTFFASSPLGLNPPGLADDEAFLRELATVAANKPANADLPSTCLADFVETFWRVLGDPDLPHLFFIEGGAAAAENALKVAFDWKSRRNEAAGRSAGLGTRAMHLRHAFHGRSGYTLSLTNTDPVKVDRFPKFDWPRIPSPAARFPLSEHLAQVEEEEAEALEAARAAFSANPHDIACFIAEPIQAEGGDRHLRPEFLRAMQELCLEHEALFVLDEVQTGVGVTGTPWCYQQLGLEPDVVAFGKKVQLGGVMAGRRVDEEPENVFEVPSRISSTWGGNLTDMLRSTRLLELIESTGAIDNAARVGAHLLDRLSEVTDGHREVMSNARGRGLLVAVDLATSRDRDDVLTSLRTEEHVLALACGDVSLRFRPSLAVSLEEADLACEALDRVLQKKGM